METGLYGCKECPYLTESFPDLKNHVTAVHRNIRGFRCNKCSFQTDKKLNLDMHIEKTHPIKVEETHKEAPDIGSKYEQVKDENGSQWSENDFPDLFEKPETQENYTTPLEGGDFMESHEVDNFKKSDSGSVKEEEPLQVVYASVGSEMIDYNDVY